MSILDRHGAAGRDSRRRDEVAARRRRVAHRSTNVDAHQELCKCRARVAVEGFIKGIHRSPYHGFSVEFSEYREYSPATTRAISTGVSSPGPIATT